jgi:hypothetical protein
VLNSACGPAAPAVAKTPVPASADTSDIMETAP